MKSINVQISQLMYDKTIRDGRDPNINPITQEEIAEAIGIPQGTISRWAGNKVDRLDKRIMVKLCEFFECEIGELLNLESNVE